MKDFTILPSSSSHHFADPGPAEPPTSFAEAIRALEAAPSRHDVVRAIGQTKQAENEAIREAVEGGPEVREMVRALERLRDGVLDYRIADGDIEANTELSVVGKRRRGAEAREALEQAVSRAVAGFLEARDRLLDATRSSAADGAVSLARVDGSVLRDMLPEDFADTLEGAILSDDRALVGALLPSAKTYLRTRAHYKRDRNPEVHDRLSELLRVGAQVTQTPGSVRHEHAHRVVDELRRDLRVAVKAVQAGEDLELLVTPTDTGRTALNAFTSRLGGDEG